MVNITVFEFHNHGPVPSLFSTQNENESAEPEQPVAPDTESNSTIPGVLGMVVLLVGLVIVAALYRWKKSTAPDDSYGIESVEVAEYEE